ncbi:hypothetical protein KIN20_029437 [Parelaphostrongylus tenuis]|uniref:Uncharacterized protein n=1 Tax=Parelaphostrongylus tenuis TaxID=148309 RepID=A0AAD5R2S3_PARTN|nr:hypothetical protein KIN20_029437 [Parelaphostrongylus tenuis]
MGFLSAITFSNDTGTEKSTRSGFDAIVSRSDVDAVADFFTAEEMRDTVTAGGLAPIPRAEKIQVRDDGRLRSPQVGNEGVGRGVEYATDGARVADIFKGRRMADASQENGKKKSRSHATPTKTTVDRLFEFSVNKKQSESNSNTCWERRHMTAEKLGTDLPAIRRQLIKSLVQQMPEKKTQTIRAQFIRNVVYFADDYLVEDEWVQDELFGTVELIML